MFATNIPIYHENKILPFTEIEYDQLYECHTYCNNDNNNNTIISINSDLVI